MPIKVLLFLPFFAISFLTSCQLQPKQPVDKNSAKSHATHQQKIALVPEKISQPIKVISPPKQVIVTAKKPVVVAVAPKKILKKIEYRDAWWYIKNSNVLSVPKNNAIKAQLKWFASHQEYLDRVARRAEPYLYFILEELKKNDMPLELALLPIVESGFQSFAYSHGSAAGIWQFIPSTGRLYGLKQNWWYDGRRDVIQSTKAAIKLLKTLGKRYKGDWLLALAAYNWGPGNLNRAIRKNKRKNKGTSFWELKLPTETKSYVPKLLALKLLIDQPKKYNIKWRTIPYLPAIQTVNTKSQIDLALVAKLADVPIETVYRYNSGLNRWATPPKGPHKIVLPNFSAKKLIAGLKVTPKNKRVTWKRHKIREGETLSHIAINYHTTVSQIRRLNNIYRKPIRAGKYLIVPKAGKQLQSYSLSASQRSNKIKSYKRSGKKVTIKVKSGDNFWDLSRQYSVTVKQIAKWNGLAPRDQLRIGQKLVIWSKKKVPVSYATLLNSPGFEKLSKSQTINYKVRNGDSLERIANKFHVRVYDLKKWNKKLKNTKYIHPGQKIRLYIDVRNQSS